MGYSKTFCQVDPKTSGWGRSFLTAYDAAYDAAWTLTPKKLLVRTVVPYRPGPICARGDGSWRRPDHFLYLPLIQA
ncbi:hypothetical protein PENSUB_10417 [Penicillium subrubescens]|uniref:Uncharacterized protein n=1 Tax=Penicillium subrubescens TaxID=1316194 RepID=A0A1Q5T9H5_9EURO|nr:hypothetical protein PENSUB_10417 [Penicillium subrubescens]